MADDISRRLQPLRARHPEARWLEPLKMHLTLVFLGPTDAAEVARLGSAMAEVAARWRSLEVSTGRADGYLGSRRGGVAWLMIEQGRSELSRLSRELDEAMAAGVYARHEPRPHLTVARRVEAPLLQELQEMPAIAARFGIGEIQLLRSHTGPGGSRYEPLTTYHLVG